MTPTTPQLAHKLDKYSQRINMTLNTPVKHVAGLRIWAPLSPVTHPRAVTESFGNIVRRVRVNRKSEPASMELEAALETMLKHRPAPEAPPGPVGVWAVVTPKGTEPLVCAPDPTPVLRGEQLNRKAVETTAKDLEQSFYDGARFYQIRRFIYQWPRKTGADCGQ